MGGFERIREELVSLFEPAQEADVRADEFQPPGSPADGVNSSNAWEHLRV